MSALTAARSFRRLRALWIIAGIAGCKVAAEVPEQPATPTPAAQPQTPAADPKLEVATAQREAARAPEGALQLAGDLRPEYAADLAFKIAGQLLRVHVARGENVKKGQLLASLADDEARAQLAQTEAAVQQARAQLALAKDNEARLVSLLAASAVSTGQVTAVRLQSETAQAALLQASAVRDLANVTLANHQLKAPFDGEIVKVPDGVGQIVGAGTVLFRIEALDRLLLRATVSESELDRIHVGDEVIALTSTGRSVTGKVRLVLRSLEPTSRRAPIEVSIPNRDHALVAGSYLRATLKAH
jgi:membrane fusion protein (multidrug efflux system)